MTDEQIKMRALKWAYDNEEWHKSSVDAYQAGFYDGNLQRETAEGMLQSLKFDKQTIELYVDDNIASSNPERQALGRFQRDNLLPMLTNAIASYTNWIEMYHGEYTTED